MDYYQIGPILKEFRIRHCISQEELCFGLCATSTLSRMVMELSRLSLSAVLICYTYLIFRYRNNIAKKMFDSHKILWDN